MTEQRRITITNDVPSRPLTDFKLVVPYWDKGRLGLRITQAARDNQEPQTREQLAAMADVSPGQIFPMDSTPIHVEVKAKRKSDGGIDEWDEVYIVPMYWSNEEVDEYLSPRLRRVFEDAKDRYVSMGSGWRWTER